MSEIIIGLVGNPNCGKTTIFNALTGARQQIGNWPGVTVERKSGCFKHQGKTVEVVDLPGVYSLTMASESSSIDERIACDYVLSNHAQVIVNILDASNLERNLYLTVQLLEMQVPLILAVNMMDVARQRNIKIDLELLAKRLGCPVIPLEANKAKGIKELKNQIARLRDQAKISAPKPRYPEMITRVLQQLEPAVCTVLSPEDQQRAHWLAVRLLENDVYAERQMTAPVLQLNRELQTKIATELGEDADILLADARYGLIREWMAEVLRRTQDVRQTFTAFFDRIVLNRVLGIPVFLLMMYFMFFFSINIGGAFQDFFDIGSDTIFVRGLNYLLLNIGVPTWLTAILANGIGKGINTTLTFIPVIGAMFLFLAFLERSGYMARAAFVVDRFMRALGLPGKSFVPMIVGFGCNVPAVMATRTLDNKRDRILTIMMSPFMSCGARLAIYAVFTAAFFPIGGQNVVFILYFLGIVMAVLTGLLLRKTVLHGDPSPLVMELPPYHVPDVKSLLLHAWHRLKSFLFRAGKIIVPVCVLIGALNSLNIDGSLNTGEGDVHSLLSATGRALTPVFAPMGIQQDNWPATVGLVTGILAKEVVIGTLNTLYSQAGHLVTATSDSAFSFWGGLQDAVSSIPANLLGLGSSLGNPVSAAQSPVHSLTQGVYGVMYQRFDGQIGAMAYLLFVLLYFPCISTTAAMLRELNRSWTAFSVCWTTGVAYGVAVTFYQAATFLRHPLASLLWIVGIFAVFLLTILIIRNYARYRERYSLELAKGVL